MGLSTSIIGRNYFRNSVCTCKSVFSLQGQQDLLETANKWAQSCHVYKWFEDMEPTPRPTDFLSKFIDGHDP